MEGLFLYLPAAPLQRALVATKRSRELTWEELACHLGVSSRTLARIMSAEKVKVSLADHMSLRLGLHPVLLWPNEWQVADFEDDSSKKSLKEVV
jgi:hypothetical protein